eukprot:TRINITY_DN2496_c0_g1_i1.p2 TRINITY_DN2496_c0_g1~~TRINITY_DN2496_c0_g1_i1.p2  ORF type:complete len:192 (+),score=31.54 TRINITY_DN2496_c0_g1_i1:83-658(+)
MAHYLAQLQAQLQDFVEEKNEEFHSILKESFENADTNKNGTIEAQEAVKLVDSMFDKLQAPLKEYGIKVTKLSEASILKIMKQADINQDQKLDQEEFKDFFLKLLSLMGVKFATGFIQKYGVGILCGIGGVVVAKTIAEKVPVAGSIISPFLVLIPTMIVGPALGIAVVYGLEQGDILAAKKKLFPPVQKQ